MGIWNRWLLGAILLAAAFAASSARAQDGPLAPACFAHSDRTVPLAAMAAASPRWDCDGGGWNNNAPVSWLRFDASAWQGREPPAAFFTRLARYRSITLAAVDGDGTIRSLRHDEAAGQPIAAGPVFTLPLPQVTPETQAVVVRIAGPHSAPMVTEARLTADAAAADWGVAEMLLLAMIAGMLVTPLIFDINFYIVLRQRFVLLHGAMVLAMIAYILFAGGLAPLLFDPSVPLMAVGGALSWSLGVAASAFFLLAFLDRDALSPHLRLALRAAGWWTLIGISFFALQLPWTQPIDNRGYFYGFVPVILIYTVCLIQAVIRGSRPARFVAAAWLPIIAAASERLMRGLGLYAAPSSLDQLLYVALAGEVVIIALGVADKFLALRRERDLALARAQMLEEISERDPLTGLYNRRALERPFGTLVAQGFTTMALVDLDRFKTINDEYGHAKGDEVLQVTALALDPDDNTLVVRMGGEEFLMLVRGERGIQRTEMRRRAITRRILAEVSGLDLPVTASIGLVDFRRLAEEGQADFATIYARADQLLYDAKEAGRNTLSFDSLALFDPDEPVPVGASPAVRPAAAG